MDTAEPNNQPAQTPTTPSQRKPARRETARIVIASMSIGAILATGAGLAIQRNGGLRARPNASGTTPAATNPADSLPGDLRPADSRPLETRPLETQSSGKDCEPLMKRVRSEARRQAKLAEESWFYEEYSEASDTMAAADTAVSESEAPAASASDPSKSSATNVQEVGVDEGDLTEHDGRYLYTPLDGELVVVDTTTGSVVSTIAPTSGNDQLILHEDRLLVAGTPVEGGSIRSTVYDVSNPTDPRSLSQFELPGSLTESRSIGASARLVVLQQTYANLAFVVPEREDESAIAAARMANNKLINELQPSQVFPVRNMGRGGLVPIDCSKITLPKGADPRYYTTVVDVDLAEATQDIGVSIGGVPGGVYQSRNRLYTWPDNWTGQGVTMMNVTDIAGATSKYLTTIEVPGRLLNQFAVSEYEKHLRIATTIANQPSSSILTYKYTDDRFIKVGQLDDIGKPGETIYSVRYAGDTGYVVTFKNTDPLYVIDLSDPTQPKKNGELEIPGYSSYLQVVSEGRVIGIGQDVSTTGERDESGNLLSTGQASLFDVSDPKNPKRLSTLPLGEGSVSEADHHAFLWWAKTKTLVIPFQQAHDYQKALTPRDPVMVIAVDGDKLVRRGRVTHQSPEGTPTDATTTVASPETEAAYSVRRAMVIEDQLITVSNEAVKSTDLVNLYPNWYLTELPSR